METSPWRSKMGAVIVLMLCLWPTIHLAELVGSERPSSSMVRCSWCRSSTECGSSASSADQSTEPAPAGHLQGDAIAAIADPFENLAHGTPAWSCGDGLPRSSHAWSTTLLGRPGHEDRDEGRDDRNPLADLGRVDLGPCRGPARAMQSASVARTDEGDRAHVELPWRVSPSRRAFRRRSGFSRSAASPIATSAVPSVKRCGSSDRA